MFARFLSLTILLFCLISSSTATRFAPIGLTSCNVCDRQTLSTSLNDALLKQTEPKILYNPTVTIKNSIPEVHTSFGKAIANPTLAYLLLLFGIYGIVFELLNPGSLIPAIIGTLALLLACYELQFFPVNYTALGLIILGITFIISEAFTPSYGVLGFGGTLVFILGSFFLVETNRDNYEIAKPVLWAMALLNSVILLSIAGVLFKTRRGKLEHGIGALVGSQGRTLEIINLNGQAVIKGEIWNVQSRQIIAANKPIKVLAAHGLHLEVAEIADR